MKDSLRNIRLIAWTLVLEAWRRREIYAIVLATTLFLVALRFVKFFDMEGMSKFYREIGLKTMNLTAALTVILLAARQLPREFADRTIYPLLAKPVRRVEFLIGKYLGVLGAGIFCYGLFMAVFLLASLRLRSPVEPLLFAQSVYLQIVALAVVAAMVFFLSMCLNADAAITLATILYVVSQVLMNLFSELYHYVGPLGKWVLIGANYVIPQLTLFDASKRVVHSINEGQVLWGPIETGAIVSLTVYGLVYVLLFLGLAQLLFRRKAL